jgi:hypothetical protein
MQLKRFPFPLFRARVLTVLLATARRASDGRKEMGP